MQKLHMVGFTTDHRGLIFSVRRGAKSGGYVVNVDASIIEAIDELKALLAEETSADADANPAAANRPQSALSVREIQARLRRGRTIDQVAREAGVEPSWIMRFAAPVLAEQTEVIRAARATHMTKQRNNIAGATLGDAVYRNIAERGVVDPRDQLDKAWRARQLTEGMWLITFTYNARGRDNKAQWEYDEANRVVRARGRLGGVIGWREGPRRAPATARASVAKKAAKATKKATKTSAKKAAKRTAPAKRAAPAKKMAIETVGPPRTAVAKKAAAAAPTTARQSSSRQATRRVAALRRAAAARLEAEAEKATRRDIAAVRKAAKRPVVVPPRLTPLPSFGRLLFDEPEAEAPELDLELQWETAEPLDTEPGPAPQEGEVEVDEAVDADDDVVDADEAPPADEDETEIDEEPEPEDDEPEDDEPEDDEPEDEPEPEDEVEIEDEPEVEVEPEPEVEVEPAPARADATVVVPRSVRRREPLRARPPVEPAEGNGPVFRNDLAPAAGATHAISRSAVGQSPDVPLSMPLEPIEPPPRRRRLRPLRGR